MTAMGSVVEVTCRHRHACGGCGYPIERGWRAVTWSGVDEEAASWFRCWWHVACDVRRIETIDHGEWPECSPALLDDDEWMALCRAFAVWDEP